MPNFSGFIDYYQNFAKKIPYQNKSARDINSNKNTHTKKYISVQVLASQGGEIALDYALYRHDLLTNS